MVASSKALGSIRKIVLKVSRVSRERLTALISEKAKNLVNGCRLKVARSAPVAKVSMVSWSLGRQVVEL